MGAPSSPPEGLVRVQRIAREVAEEACAGTAPGASELETAARVAALLRERCVEETWSITNVGFGEGSRICFPTYPPTERVLGQVDVGHVDVHPAAADGWWGDCTRTVVSGESSAHAQALADLRRIHEDALARCRPGMRARDLFDPTLEAIEAAGYELLDLWHNIGHSLRRGSAYDDKFIDTTNETEMWGAWAIEPFIGRDGFGVKLEDVVWFGDGGCEVLR
jgi:Xaa-Pro aminopeptidase